MLRLIMVEFLCCKFIDSVDVHFSGERDLKDTILWGSTKEIIIKVTEIINGKKDKNYPIFSDLRIEQIFPQMKRWQQFQSANVAVDFRGRTISMQSTISTVSQPVKQTATIKLK